MDNSNNKRKRKHRENPDRDDGFSMARPSYKNGAGQQRKGSIYHVRFKDTDSIWRRLPLFTDLQSSKIFARNLVRLVSLKAAGGALDPDLREWSDSIDATKREKLFAWGILSRRFVGAVKPLAEHLNDWRDSIRDDGSTEGNARQRWFRTKGILLDRCGYIRFTEIDPLRVTKQLSNLGLKERTRNHYAAAIRQFGKWMVRNHRATQSPVEGLVNVKVTDDRRRRSLSVEQFTKLLTTTMDGPAKRGLSGWERSTLYHLASETGFRANELRSLTVASFDLDTEPATVALHAGDAKNKRRARLSITPELAARLRTCLQGKSPAAKAFYVPHETANMLRFDLKEAGIPFENDQGEVFDFHALRVQLAANMVRGGVHVRAMQERMRHSSSKLTLDIYSRLSRSEQDETAVEALPRLALGA